MFKNYFKIAFRNIIKHKGYSFINISGLALGMACTILILLWVKDELNFDKYHEKADQIYRVGSQYRPTVDSRGAYTAPPMARAFLNDFPEVLQVVRLNLWQRNRLVNYKDKNFTEKGIILADASIFDVFTIPFIRGNPKTALTKPKTFVITQAIAKKYFGNEDPVGKVLTIDNNEEYLVTGVVENCPHNSHFYFDFIASLVTSESSSSDRWMSHCYFTYIVLQEGYPPSRLEAKFPDFIKRHYGPQFQKETGISIEEYFKDENKYYGYWLQPLSDIHLNADIHDNLKTKGDITYVYIFSIIALFILLIACINFMNLSTARAANRSKEIGLRKVLGSLKTQLVHQFLGESILLSFIALIIAVIIVEAVLPIFNSLSVRHLGLNLFSNFYILPGLLGATMLVGILAGIYPAFFLSAFRTVSVLKGKLSKSKKSSWLRSGLVIFQFSISIIILISTFVIYNQLKYLRDVKLGFDKEQVLVIHRAYALGKQREAFKQELLQNSDILTISNTNSLPGRHFDPNGHRLEGDPGYKEYTLHTMYGDYDFAKLLNLEMAGGRYFSKNIASDASAVVINETAVRELSLTDPIGKRFHKEFGGAKPGEFVTIIGVLKDYHFFSLHHKILPMVIRNLNESMGSYTSIRIDPGKTRESLNLIEDTWKKFTGGQPFEYSFLDEDFYNLYKKEQKTGQILLVFSILAIFIACLGLFGLISFTVEQRTREIGIRKVLGASVSGITALLSKETTKWVLFANIIAWPAAYFAMDKWLQNFAYRINIGIETFILSGSLALIIALLTVSYQSVKASAANPVDALKYE